MQPGPWMSASVKVVPALMTTEGETFQPWPSSRGRLLSGALGGHSAFAFFAGEILRADGTGQGFGSATKIRQQAGRWIRESLRRRPPMRL